MDNATPTEVLESPTLPVPAQTNAELVFERHGLAYGAYARECWAKRETPTNFVDWLTASTADRLPDAVMADDSFRTIKDGALRDLLTYRGHSVWEQDGLWFSCCTTTCHEDQAEAEQSCVGGLASALGGEVQP